MLHVGGRGWVRGTLHPKVRMHVRRRMCVCGGGGGHVEAFPHWRQVLVPRFMCLRNPSHLHPSFVLVCVEGCRCGSTMLWMRAWVDVFDCLRQDGRSRAFGIGFLSRGCGWRWCSLDGTVVRLFLLLRGPHVWWVHPVHFLQRGRIRVVLGIDASSMHLHLLFGWVGWSQIHRSSMHLLCVGWDGRPCIRLGTGWHGACRRCLAWNIAEEGWRTRWKRTNTSYVDVPRPW